MIYIVSELYYPEETSTGHYLTRIAEGLAQTGEVSVLCSQPTYSQRGIKAPTNEVHNGVKICRCWGGRLNKDLLPLRIINFFTISISLFLSGLIRFKRCDKVIVVTNPPLLPFLITLASKLKRSTPILLVHDVYPEVLIAAGILKPGSLTCNLIQGVTRWLYKNVKKVIVIGRDMKKIAISKCGNTDKVHLITNWADLDIVKPLIRDENSLLKSHGLLNKFVVQYCGNMGRTHGLEYLLETAEELQNRNNLHFLMIGSGARKNWLEKNVEDRKISNITILPRCQRDSLNETLNACDIAVISFVPGMSGISVPSRMYNIMAAGKPILAIADDESELATVVKEENIGWVVPPGEIKLLKTAIKDAKSDRIRLQKMGERARIAAESKYSLANIITDYRNLLEMS